MIEILEKENEIKENSQGIGETLLERLNTENDYNDFLVLILKVKYRNDFSNLDMFGLKAIDYIKSAVNVCETKIEEYSLEDDIVKTIKQNLNSKKFVAVVFSDTPLIRRHTFLEILDYFKYKKLCALKFNRGYVFETEYIKSVEKVYNPQVQNFSEEDFYKVSDERSFAFALEGLKHRILSYHQNRGVIIKDLNTTFIDAEVNIDSGVIIEENVKIMGKTIVKNNSKIGFNSKIKNAIIEEGAVVENSLIENAVIMNNAKVLDFSVVKNVSINENTIVSNEKIIKE